ncbi:DegT/DnrJ/EryC1/StrS family aminotransferase [Thermospira aquatica]|uniref:DegT/DnrJ/EryC1/StrS family aminotransferase n=1 Tax=Thermospira aquatica TaxID=2828656 RepID=A0AAX3BCC6_9SPIR|nr:DegT/DnrJ/EryC1/StrS family aminotransferase [Thermospira aquatica]
MDFIDLKTQYQRDKQAIWERLSRNMENASFILGPDVAELEKTLAHYVGVKHAIGVASGTDALLIPLLAYGIGPGDEVITTPFTFVATVEVIALLGAKPVFVDIDPKTYLIDIHQVEKAITPRTKGIISVSLYGQTPDMDALNSIAKKHNLWVMEDAAQSFGAIYKDKKSCNLSDVAATSFFPSKPLGCYGDGGMIFTNDDELALKMRQIANHGQHVRYQHCYVGINARLDTLQAAVLLAKWPHFEEEANSRHHIGQRYTELLKNTVVTPVLEKNTTRSVYAQYTIRVQNRDSVINFLKDKGIPTAVHYPIPLHLQEAYRSLGYKEGDFPHAEKAAQEVMSLPMHPFLTEETMQYIVDNVKQAVR